MDFLSITDVKQQVFFLPHIGLAVASAFVMAGTGLPLWLVVVVDCFAGASMTLFLAGAL